MMTTTFPHTPPDDPGLEPEDDRANLVLTSPVAIVLVALLIMAIVAIGFAMILAATRPSNAQTKSEWYKSLALPGRPAGSCCSDSDCRPVNSERRKGQWWAEIAYDGVTKWLPVPDEKIIPWPVQTVDEEGRAVACVSDGHAKEWVVGPYSDANGKQIYNPPNDPMFYCFVPPALTF
jgi:hypothetical protein